MSNHFFETIQSASAENMTAIEKNEFGEMSFSFTAPDGYFWTIISLESESEK